MTGACRSISNRRDPILGSDAEGNERGPAPRCCCGVLAAARSPVVPTAPHCARMQALVWVPHHAASRADPTGGDVGKGLGLQTGAAEPPLCPPGWSGGVPPHYFRLSHPAPGAMGWRMKSSAHPSMPTLCLCCSLLTHGEGSELGGWPGAPYDAQGCAERVSPCSKEFSGVCEVVVVLLGSVALCLWVDGRADVSRCRIAFLTN